MREVKLWKLKSGLLDSTYVEVSPSGIICKTSPFWRTTADEECLIMPICGSSKPYALIENGAIQEVHIPEGHLMRHIPEFRGYCKIANKEMVFQRLIPFEGDCYVKSSCTNDGDTAIVVNTVKYGFVMAPLRGACLRCANEGAFSLWNLPGSTFYSASVGLPIEAMMGILPAV